MLLGAFTSVLSALSLSQTLSKPIPLVVDVTQAVTKPLLGATKGLAAPLLGVTKDITTPLVGAINEVTAPLLGAVKDISQPLLGAVHDITDPLLQPVKQIVDPLLGTVDDLTSLLGLPLKNLPLLDILQSSKSHDTAEPAASAQSLATDSTPSDDGSSSNDAPSFVNLAKVNVAQAQAQGAGSPSCQVDAYDAPVETITFTPFDAAAGNIFRYRQQQAVNLGSWFVHEDWMTPSVFSCAAGKRTSELDIANGWGSTANARSVLEHHWDTWITKSDFTYLASIGINTVRLPIGYWSLGPDFLYGTDFAGVADVYRGSWWRVKRAISWAAENGIGVLVDLHAAPGSQNGQAHSGISTGKTGLFTSEDNMSKTINVLTYLAQQLGTVTNVVGLQILNEPDNVDGLPAFYDRAISAIRASSAGGQALPLYVHDGFNLDRFSAYVAGRSDFVVEDHHSYFVFTEHDAAEPVRQHTVDIATGTDRALSLASGRQRRNLVIGEWSCALTPQSLQAESDPTDARTAFCTGQEEVYRNETAGWYFWSYKMENADAGWAFRDAVGKSLPSTFFSYTSGQPTGTSGSLLGQAPAGAKRDHRFAAINQRRQAAADPQDARGYSDAVSTVKIFASYSRSKLGFIDQYINDSIKALGSVVPAGTEDQYRRGFMRGLLEAEALVVNTMY